MIPENSILRSILTRQEQRYVEAGPELYSALAALLNSIDEGELRPFNPAFDPQGVRKLTRDRINAARAAVARVEGF